MAHRFALIGFLVLLLGPAGAAAQTAEADEITPVRVVTEENFRQTPGGKRLATVREGTRLVVTGREDDWREVVLSGWAPTASLGQTGQNVYDLVVSRSGGEELRDEPNREGRVAAAMLRGFLLARVEVSGDWTRVRRTGWMWGPSLEEVETPPESASSAGRASPGAGEASENPSERLVVGGTAVRMFLSPEGDTVGVARPGSDLTVLGRQGEWARVRMEGWVRSSELEDPEASDAAPELTIADLRANPGRFDGRRVSWELQFISLERAEPARTDFYEGEPFILARPPSAGEGFVYLAVPPELVSRVEQLEPLRSIRVRARVRTGRSALMGAPILDLLELR